MADDKSKDAKSDASKAADAKAAAAGSGGIKGMLPLIITVVLMPVLAFVMTKFVILPKIQQAIIAGATVTESEEGEPGAADEAVEVQPTDDSHEKPAGSDGKEAVAKPVAKGAKATYTLQKLIVNMRGSLGTRYLMSSYTLVGKGEEFKTLCQRNDEQIRDVAMGILSSKSIQDLEKPDHRNMIRTELMSTINTTLGKPAVQEIYITEFAIQ